MSKHLYLGPYIECTYKPTKRTDYVRGCPSTSCVKHPSKVSYAPSGKFCSACGSPNEKVPIEVDDRPDLAAVVDEQLFEMNSRKDITWLAPNIRRPGAPRPKLKEDDVFCLDLREVDRAAEMAWLERAFAPELVKLRAAYATVEIKWGLVQYFM